MAVTQQGWAECHPGLGLTVPLLQGLSLGITQAQPSQFVVQRRKVAQADTQP